MKDNQIKEAGSIKVKLEFENAYEITEYINKAIRNSEAWEYTANRLGEAHDYCKNNLMPNAWGRNVWHAILDDAIRMREELKSQSEAKVSK